MTGEPSGPMVRARPGSVTPTRSVPVLLPMPAVRAVSASAGPRWPDRPIHHTAPVRPAGQRERAAACSVSS
jgi:hypothetical protein